VNESADHVTVTLELNDLPMIRVLGVHDRVLTALESECPGVQISARSNSITISGKEKDVSRTENIVSDLARIAREGIDLNVEHVSAVASMKRKERAESTSFLTDPVLVARGNSIFPKTSGQRDYVESIDSHTITFGIGPAGTGKTYLAMAKAVSALQAKQVERIILTRPAVEAGERLGFLPGSLSEKIDPYLRPLLDALHEMIEPSLIPKLLESGVVELAPLAYMRGRTLNASFVILDEAQNTSSQQMKMFLTRLGFGSKMVITGDITQVDLPGGSSGLKVVDGILSKLPEINFKYLNSKDVVRHSLVSEIVDAYTDFENRGEEKRGD